MLVLLVGGTALLGGCRTPEGYAPLPVPDKSDAALTTPTTQAPDHAAVELAGARGTTTTSAPAVGDTDEAVSKLEEALNVKPDYAPARTLLESLR